MSIRKYAMVRCDEINCHAEFRDDDTGSAPVIRLWASWKGWQTGSTLDGLDLCPEHAKYVTRRRRF